MPDVFIMHESCICQPDVRLQFRYESANVCGTFVVIHRWQKTSVALGAYSPLRVTTGRSAFSFQLLPCTMPFWRLYLPPSFFCICVLSMGDFSCLTWPSSSVEMLSRAPKWKRCRSHMCVGETFPFGMGARQRPWKLWLYCL